MELSLADAKKHLGYTYVKKLYLILLLGKYHAGEVAGNCLRWIEHETRCSDERQIMWLVVIL